MKRTFLITLVLGFFYQTGIAQSFDKATLDRYLDTLEINNKFMGSVAISKSDEVIYSRSIGYADFEHKIKADKNTKYRIGSITKTFTAVLVLKAIEKNKIDLNQSIDKFFPAIKNAGKITVNQLLHHRSGIHNFTNDKEYLTWNTKPKTQKEMIEIIAKGGSDFEPGSKYEYSNSNYVLLTFILQQAFDQQYSDLLTEYITKPLRLKNTYLGGKINVQNGESKSYKFSGTWKVEPETDISVPLGAGGIVSTPGDLVKFSYALFNGKLLTQESLEQMKSLKDGYGMGLIQIPFYEKRGYGHTGGIDGFTSVFVYFPDGDISYALTSNGTNYNTNNISIAVLSAVYGKPFKMPEFNKTYEVSSKDLDKYLGVYASKQIPLKMTITKQNDTLIAQATGQSSFPLKATAKDKFEFEQAGIILEFSPKDSTMILTQGGGEVKFNKE